MKNDKGKYQMADDPLALKKIDDALDKTTASIIYAPGNQVIRDRFEKASILLAANRISGAEYIDYLTIRLGIPVSQEIRRNILIKYRASDVRESAGWIMSKKERNNIQNNLRVTTKVVKDIGTSTGGDIAKAVVRSGAYAVGAGLLGAIAGTIFAPFIVPFIAGGATLGLVAGAARSKMLSNRKTKAGNKIEGWERVETLIQELDRQRADLINSARTKNMYANYGDKVKVGGRLSDAINDGDSDRNKILKDVGRGFTGTPAEEAEDKKETLELLDQLQKAVSGALESAAKEKRAVNASVEYTVDETIEMINEGLDIIEYVHETLLEESDEYATRFYNTMLEEEILHEKKFEIDTTVPVKAKTIVYNPKETLVTPAYSTRSQLAYGSAEYDRREVKDRKYNAPLVMTITFRERLSDGKYTDNELTAVIGIQGVVVRVPSDEMKYILKSNAEGNVLKGFLGSNTIVNSVADLLSTTKLQKDVEKLPISSDVWHNLEKIGHLALANKLGGKQSHNISNAHIIFSQKEIDEVRNEYGIDYLKDKKLAEQLMKRYSAFSIMIVSDPSERLYVFDDPENISWNVIPYSALRNRDSADQLSSALIRATQGRI